MTPAEYVLLQNHPNPFNPSTKIAYGIAEPRFVSIKVYNTVGQIVATLVNETKEAGNYTVDWNASGTPSGIYFYQIIAGKFTDTKKMLLMR